MRHWVMTPLGSSIKKSTKCYRCARLVQKLVFLGIFANVILVFKPEYPV